MTESSQVCEANIIFDDGSKCSWAGRISCGSNTTYSLILRSFVSYYNASNNKALDINDLTISICTPDVAIGQYFKDQNHFIRSSKEPLEILIKTKEREQITDSVHCQTEVLNKLIEIGDSFAAKNKNGSAFIFYNESGEYGLWNLFKLLYKTKAWKTIVDRYTDIINFIPNTTESNIIIAEAYEHLGKNNEAFKIYRNALMNGFASCHIYTRLARLFILNQNLASAKVQTSNALIMDNQDPEAILQLAKIYLLTSNYEASVKTLLRCPKNYKYIPQFFQNNLSFTKQFLGTINTLSVNTHSLLSLCKTLYENGSVNEPLTILKNAYITSKCDVEISLLFFSILLDQNQFTLILEHSYEFVRTYCHTTIRGFALPKFYEALLNYHGKVIDNQISDISMDSFNFSSYIACVFCIIIAYYFEINQRDILVFIESQFGYSYCTTLLASKDTLPIVEIFFLCHDAIVESMNDFETKSNTTMCIGDQNVIQTAFDNIKIKDNVTTLKPFPFYNLSIWKLREASNSPQKERFFSILQTLSNHNGLLIMLGTYDCEIEIPKLINKCLSTTVSKVIKSIIEIYISLLKTIREKNPTVNIFVHPALARLHCSYHIVTYFNNKLQKALKPLENIYYLDVPNIKTKQLSKFNYNFCNISYSRYCNYLKTGFQKLFPETKTSLKNIKHK